MTRTLLVSLVTLGDPGRLTGGYLYHRRMAELAPEHGAELRFVSVPERPFPLPALAGRKVLRRALRPARAAPPATPAPRAAPADGAGGPAGGGRADVVVLDSIAAAFLGPWLALGRLPVPLVGSLHKLPAGRILVVPPGRDVAAAPGAPAGDLRQGRRAALLCVANWIGRKGILETLEALARLDPGTATLHLAGDDRADPLYAAMVRARLSRPDLAGRVVVHGPLPIEAIAALYQAADVFVLPSVREPYGTVWGEAMAAGLPVVGWRAGNLPHLAGEGEALLVPPGDVEGLSRALALLAGDEPLRRRMGEAARRRASDRPTWRDSAARFFDALREAAQGPRGERR